MAEKLRAIGVAWFRTEDYQRIREISDDEMIPTFGEWEAKMAKFLASREAPGVILEKVIVDPDELLTYARQHHGGKIDTKVRSAYAAWLIMQKYGTNH
jgi:hypothetical protein